MEERRDDEGGSVYHELKELQQHEEGGEQSLVQESDVDNDRHHHPSELDEFIDMIQSDELCRAASRLRNGLSCHLGDRTIGGK